MADSQKSLPIWREQDLFHIWLVPAEKNGLVPQVPHVHLDTYRGVKNKNPLTLSDSAITRVRRSLESAEAVMTAPTLAREKFETREPVRKSHNLLIDD